MNKNVKQNAKIIARMVGAICGSFVAGRIIGTVVPNTGTIGNIVTMIGAGCIGGVIGDKCGKYLENQVGLVCDLVDACSNVTA